MLCLVSNLLQLPDLVQICRKKEVMIKFVRIKKIWLYLQVDKNHNLVPPDVDFV